MEKGYETADIEQMSFRQGMDELTLIVNALEGNTLELEAALEKYERGIALLRNLAGRLDQAEQRVNQLMGELEQAPTDEQIDTQLNKA